MEPMKQMCRGQLLYMYLYEKLFLFLIEAKLITYKQRKQRFNENVQIYIKQSRKI